MKNPFTKPHTSRVSLLAGIASDMIPVVPSDTDDFEHVAMGLYIETGGTLSFISSSGAERNITVTDFHRLECGVARVNATGTDALGIHAYIL